MFYDDVIIGIYMSRCTKIIINKMAVCNWLITVNNPTEIPHEMLERVYNTGKVKYICGLLEKGAEGTVHVLAFVNFKQKQRMAVLLKLIPKVHCDPVKVNNGADDYCLKEETRIEGPWEFGDKPVKRNCKLDWDRIKD